MKELIKNRRFLADNKKDKFITDHLFSYLIRHIEESEDSSKTTDLVAAMYIFPYRTREGIKIGSLKEPGIPWYYDKEDGNKEYSSDNYRIFADEVLQADQAEKIRQLFSTKRYLNEFTKAVVIDDLITRMGKETDYTEAWWKYALDFLKLWQKDKFALNVAKATENIDNNYFLFLDNYCDQSLKERLIRFGIFRDIMTPIAKIMFWDKITDAQEKYRALNVLKSLGVPHAFSVKKEGFWTGVSFRQEEMINKHILQFASDIGKNVAFPVAPGDIDYQKCELCQELFMTRIYNESKNDSIYASVQSAFENIVMAEDEEYVSGIPVINIRGEFVPLSWELFYSEEEFPCDDLNSRIDEEANDTENNEVDDFIDIALCSEFEKLHMDVTGYDRRFVEKYRRIHEFHTASKTYDEYGIDKDEAVDFYRWLWSYSHHNDLIHNVMEFFSDEKRNKFVVSEKYNDFIFSVLKEIDVNLASSSYNFSMLVNVDDAFSNAEVLNKISRCYEGIVVNITGRFEKVEVANYIEELLNNAQGSFLIKSQIENDKIWDSVFTTSGGNEGNKGVYVLSKYIENRGTKSLLLRSSDDIEAYLWALGNYIQDEYGDSIRITGSYGKKAYIDLVLGIHDFISEKMDLKSMDDLPFIVAKMDDIANYGEEKHIWHSLREQRDLIIKEDSSYSGSALGKPFLYAKYKGRCQLCGGKTITGENNSRFFTYRIVKESQNSLANMPSNLFCLCPTCWGKLEKGAFMGKDMSEIILKAKKYVDYLNKVIDNTDFEDNFPSLISELLEDQNLTKEEEERLEGFHKPIICRVVVNGESRCMAFSWEHFMRLAFILSEYENDEVVKDTEYPRMNTF